MEPIQKIFFGVVSFVSVLVLILLGGASNHGQLTVGACHCLAGFRCRHTAGVRPHEWLPVGAVDYRHP